jgi:AcrR family transcriptional regulator
VPRVSEAHLAARRQQILDAARRCFLRNGFHNASMQDVIAEAELSVGAVYRYFRSKTEIIAAIAEGYATEVSTDLVALSADPWRGLADVMEQAIGIVEANSGPDGVLRLAVQVWAEALRDEAVGAVAAGIYGSLQENFTRIARHAVRHGDLPPDADPEAVGPALFSLLLGYALQRLLTGRPDPEGYRRGVRTLLNVVPLRQSVGHERR